MAPYLLRIGLLLTVFVAVGCAKDAGTAASDTTAAKSLYTSYYGHANSSKNVRTVGTTDTYRKIVQRTVRSRMHQVAACYGAAAMFDDDVSGKVVVRFSIKPEGKVGSAIVTECNIDAEMLETCVLDTVQKWTFAPPPKGKSARFEYPFLFAKAL